MILDRLHLSLIGAALLVGGVALHEHDSHVREAAVRDAVQSAQATYQRQLAEQTSQIEKHMSDTASAYQSQLQSLQTQMKAAQTPSQVAQLAAQVMALKQPIQISTPAPTPSNPTPEPVATVSTSDTPLVKAYIDACETCKIEVPKLESDLADRAAEAKVAQAQIESLKTERDAAITASKGGNIVTRTVRALKYIGIGILVGAAAVCGTGHCH